MTKWGHVNYTCASCRKTVIGYPGRKTEVYCRQCQSLREKENKKQRAGGENLKRRLIKQRGRRCQQCGIETDVMMHHIISVKEGGATTPENCILLCTDCHKKKHGGRGVGPSKTK